VTHSPVATLEDAQDFKQVGELALAFVLSALIGLEREWRQKSAGLRTHTLVGVGSALFLIVYTDGRGILREVLAEATRRGFAVVRVATDRHGADVALTLDVQGRGSVQALALALDELEGVLEVAAADPQPGD
jgi:acetolactate synthase regulatory subunit